MRPEASEILRSPETTRPLRLEVFKAENDDVIEGRLIDDQDGIWFRIENGIADLTPIALRANERYEDFAKRHGLGKPRASAIPDPACRITTDQRKQIRFFDSRPEEYEHEVVLSPYSFILDRVTFIDWARRCLSPGSSILEIGCGSGRQTLPLAKLNMRCVAVDLSENLLRLSRRKLIEAGLAGNADLLVSAAEALPVRDASFDACIIYGSLHHFADPQAVLVNAAAKLREGGKFFMLEPHKSPVRFLFDWLMRLAPLWQEEAAADPLFTAEQFQEWLCRGKVDARIRYSTYLPPHLFYAMRQSSGERLLKASDGLLSSIPGLRKLAGVIIAEGTKLKDSKSAGHRT